MITSDADPAAVKQGLLADRRFLLLQGPSSRFWTHLGRAIRARGGRVTRVGFCPGDRLFWSASAGDYRPYRGRADAFRDWLRDLAGRLEITDAIMLGDGRSWHAEAIALIKAERLPIKIWVVEHGYLRPGLILIEPDGMGGSSTIPDRFATSRTAKDAPRPNGWSPSFLRYAAMDVAYHMSNVAASWHAYPYYTPHSGIPPLVEYGGWVRKAIAIPARWRSRRETLASIDAAKGPLFLLPLQLSHDMQLVRYGISEPQIETLHRVVGSFLSHAAPDARLIVKVHPLDNGLENWRGMLAGHAPRVLYLDGGDLDQLLKRVAGVVTINSTVGLSAVRAGAPTLALGASVYKSAGLTDPQELDTFWTAPRAPDQALVERFCAFLQEEFHVPGAFDGPGALVGGEELADWLAAPPAAWDAGAA